MFHCELFEYDELHYEAFVLLVQQNVTYENLGEEISKSFK